MQYHSSAPELILVLDVDLELAVELIRLVLDLDLELTVELLSYPFTVKPQKGVELLLEEAAIFFVEWHGHPHMLLLLLLLGVLDTVELLLSYPLLALKPPNGVELLDVEEAAIFFFFFFVSVVVVATRVSTRAAAAAAFIPIYRGPIIIKTTIKWGRTPA